MKSHPVLLIFLLGFTFSYGQQMKFPEKRMEDFLGMLGNNYIDLMEEELTNFVKDTGVPFTVQVSY